MTRRNMLDLSAGRISKFLAMQVVTFYGGIAADNIVSTVLKVVKIINVLMCKKTMTN